MAFTTGNEAGDCYQQQEMEALDFISIICLISKKRKLWTDPIELVCILNNNEFGTDLKSWERNRVFMPIWFYPR